jgi:hypothetical protein
MRDYWTEYCQYSTVTPYNVNDDIVRLWNDETGYDHLFTSQFFDGPLICNHSYYGPGDNFVYFIGSASGMVKARG